MNRQEEVRLDAPGFLDAHLQRHEEIGITGQHGAHVRLGIDARLDATGDFERNVLFISPHLANSAGIFTAVTGVEHDGHHTVDNRLARFFAGVNFRRLDWRFLRLDGG